MLFEVQKGVGQDDDTNQSIEEYQRGQRGEGVVGGGGGLKSRRRGRGWAKETLKRRFS